MTFLSTLADCWLGLCRKAPVLHAASAVIPGHSHPGDPCHVPARPSSEPATPPATAAPRDNACAVYTENILLVIVLLVGLFSLVNVKMLAIATVFSAMLVYYDAGTIHAGVKFPEEIILGNVVTWRPLTWALAVLIVPLIFLVIYVFSRKEIFDANT